MWEISWSSQGFDTSGGPRPHVGVDEFMDTSQHWPLSGLAVASVGGSIAGLTGSGVMGTSAVLSRHGLRKASRSVWGGTSGLLMFSQSGWRLPAGLMETSQTGSWPISSRSSRIWNGSLLAEDELSGLGGRSGSALNVLLVQTVWSLKDSTPGGGACTRVVEEVEQRPSPTMVPSLSEGGPGWLTAVSSAGLCSMMGLKDTNSLITFIDQSTEAGWDAEKVETQHPDAFKPLIDHLQQQKET